MSTFKPFAHKPRPTSTPATPTSSFLRPSRPFAPLPTSQQASPVTQAQLDHAARFGHSFDRIALFPADRLPMDARSTGNQQKGGIPDSSLETRLQKKDASAETIRQAAQAGVRTPSRRLPYAEQIQQAFGRHDVSRIQAHVGPQATASVEAMQASAYTMGNQVVFAGSPSLPVVAHEAAHVVQQRGGVQLPGGIGKVGDPYEQHADAVADRVAAGHQVEHILDQDARQAQRANEGPSSSLQELPSQSIQRLDGQLSAQPPPNPVVTPAPILSATADTAKDLEGRCGFFERFKTWHVANPGPGIIVQHVVRTFFIEKYDQTTSTWSTTLSRADLDNYVRLSSPVYAVQEPEYWELWTVGATGNVSDNNEDSFGMGSIIPGGRGNPIKNTTRGRYKIVGTATFYYSATNQPIDPGVLGFTRTGTSMANLLLSTRNDPTTQLSNLVASNTVTDTVDVTWDSTYDDSIRSYTAGTPDSQVNRAIV